LKTLNFDYFYKANHEPALLKWLDSIAPVIESQSNPKRHGHFPGWLEALHSLPHYTAKTTHLNEDVVSVSSDTDNNAQQQIKKTLLQLSPWRKGPFQIDDVLDVGCGNGYYAYRMLGAGAKTVVGVDPGELFCTQFAAINHFVKTDAATEPPAHSRRTPEGIINVPETRWRTGARDTGDRLCRC